MLAYKDNLTASENSLHEKQKALLLQNSWVHKHHYKNPQMFLTRFTHGSNQPNTTTHEHTGLPRGLSQ